MSAGRPKAYDVDVVIKHAMLLFWRQGYKATSLRDLLAATGLSKSSFYEAFGSKDALFARCVNGYREQLVAELNQKARDAHSARAFIADALMAVAEEAAPSRERIGCLLMNTATEVAQADPEIAALVAEGIGASTKVFERAVRRAQEDGEIDAAADPRALANFVVSSMGGMRTLVKAGASRRAIRKVAELSCSAF